jgi:TIR domain
MPRIFISYRREESADVSGRISDFLERRFGAHAVFRDVNAILAGSNFVKALQRALDDAQVVLVIIGPHWMDLREPNGARRIDLPTDYVRYEVATALRAGKLVVPILIDGARLPTVAELPPELAALAQTSPITVRNDPYFAADMTQAIATFRSAVAWRPASVGVLLAALGGLLSLLYVLLRAAYLITLPHYRGLDFLIFVTPVIALLFAVIRAGRTRRWLWLSLMVAAGLVVLLSYLLPFDLAQPVLYYPFLLVLFVFGLFGPRRPYQPPARRRPTHSAVLATSWIIPLALYYGLGVATHPNATSEVEAGVAFAIVGAAILAGDVMGLARAWRARSWGWGCTLALLLILSLGVIPLAVFSSVMPTAVGSLLTFALILAQMVALAIFGWWGPHPAPARPTTPSALVVPA